MSVDRYRYHTHLHAQLSLLMVVKESFKLYKAVSEGVINLADTFFEMSHLDAAKGLDIYKQYIAFTDLLQTYYTQVDQIEEIRAALKQPLDFHSATPPPEFLGQMEDYVKEAPRALEDGAVAPAPTKISPLRRGQHSSRSGMRPSAGSTQHRDPGMLFPPGAGAVLGSQELSSPREEASAPAAAGEVDLLALDFEQDVTVDAVCCVFVGLRVCRVCNCSPCFSVLSSAFQYCASPFPHSHHSPQSAVSGAPGAASPLDELFAVNTSFSSAPGGSATPGNPFGGPPLQTAGLGATGFTEPPGPVPSQHSPQLPPMGGMVPLAGQSTNVRSCVA